MGLRKEQVLDSILAQTRMPVPPEQSIKCPSPTLKMAASTPDHMQRTHNMSASLSLNHTLSQIFLPSEMPCFLLWRPLVFPSHHRRQANGKRYEPHTRESIERRV